MPSFTRAIFTTISAAAICAVAHYIRAPLIFTVSVLSLTLATSFAAFISRRNVTVGDEVLDGGRPRNRVFTFANHKGGVGKTTIALFTIKTIAEALRETHNVLVIDASKFGDISRLLLGTDSGNKKMSGLISSGKTLDNAVSMFLKPATWFSYLFGKKWTFPQSFFRLSSDALDGEIDSPPDNIYLMTNVSQRHYLAGDLDFDSPVETISDRDICRFAIRFKEDLAKTDKPWVVIIDTDGGENHAMTKLALGLANSIIIPLSPDMNCENDAARLNVLFSYVESLRRKKLSTATVGMAFFNGADSARDVWWDKVGSPFKPRQDVQEKMEVVSRSLYAPDSNWQRQYPELLRGLTRPMSECFGAVRRGGKEFALAASDPWKKTAGNAQEDISVLVGKILDIVPGLGGEDKATRNLSPLLD